MELVYECTLRATLDPHQQVVGNGPAGLRVVATVSGGTVEGERLNGTLKGAGADWIVVGSDGFGRLDVRTQIETDDGAVIYVQYAGLLELNEVSAGPGETQFEDQYFRTSPVFETGDDRYAWLNTSVFVGKGRKLADGVEYEIYRVT